MTPLGSENASWRPKQKSRPWAGFSVSEARASRHRADLRGQAALVARGLVLVDQALAGARIERRGGGLQRRFRGRLVAALDLLQDLLDGRAHLRALADVVLVALHGLAGTLLRGFDVGQRSNSGNRDGAKKGRKYPDSRGFRQIAPDSDRG